MSLEVARESYRKLMTDGLRGLSVESVFVFLDIDSSAQGAAVGESKRHFRQSNNRQNAFVIFKKDSKEGWLFPNPRISFTEGMKYVFPEMSYENFEKTKGSIEPKQVKSTAVDTWEMLGS